MSRIYLLEAGIWIARYLESRSPTLLHDPCEVALQRMAARTIKRLTIGEPASVQMFATQYAVPLTVTALPTDATMALDGC